MGRAQNPQPSTHLVDEQVVAALVGGDEAVACQEGEVAGGG